MATPTPSQGNHQSSGDTIPSADPEEPLREGTTSQHHHPGLDTHPRPQELPPVWETQGVAGKVGGVQLLMQPLHTKMRNSPKKLVDFALDLDRAEEGRRFQSDPLARRDPQKVEFSSEGAGWQHGWGGSSTGWGQRWHHPTHLLAKNQPCKGNRSAQVKGMLCGTPKAKQSPCDADTDGDLPLMPREEEWRRSPALHMRWRCPRSRAWFDHIIKAVRLQGVKSQG